MSNRSKKLIVVMLSAVMLSGCWSDDDDAVADAGTALNLKERRSVTIAGASGSGEGAVTVAWSQTSGPAVTISGADTLTPQITAPSVDADATAVLRLTVTDSKGQVATDDLTVSIINNTLPVLTAQPELVAEKTEVEVTAALSDDGEIASVSWLQTAGPEVELTGADTDTVTFTSPAVTEATTLTFMLTVTDDDDETAELELSVEVEPTLVAFTLAGSVSGADFSGGTAVLKGAYEEVSAEVDESGAFSFDLQLDDDLIDSVVGVTVNSENNSRLTYSAVYSGFTLPETVASAAVKFKPADAKVTATAEGSNTVSVNAVSTALYSLLVAANNGAVPENIDQLVFVEKSIDADELIEAAAIVKILTENPDIELPEGVTDIISLLTNVAAYNTLVQQIDAEQPGLITATVTEIIEDPELTPPVSADAIAPVYYQTSAAAPGFLSRFGEQWQFNQDGTGSRNNRLAGDNFSWTVDESGNITVTYNDGFRSSSFRGVAVGVVGLTQEQVDWLRDDNINQVLAEIITTKSVLKRIGTGQQIDSFNIKSDTLTQLLPVETSQGLVETEAVAGVSTGNILMRKQVSGQYAFTAADMSGIWAINSYYELELFNRIESSFYLDKFQFNADGSGIGLDTDRTFNWQLSNGLLQIQFADNTGLEARIIDSSGSDYQVMTLAKDADGKVIAAQADYGFKVQPDIELDWVTGAEQYWQTMINSWDKNSWDNGRLLFCQFDPLCEEPEYVYSPVFGWQFLQGGTGNRLSVNFNDFMLPPDFEPSPFALTWDSVADNSLSLQFDIQERNFNVLKVTDGVLGKRIYVQEEAVYPSGIFIGSRIGMYEQIPVSYWNDTAPQASVSAVSVKASASQQKRLVVNPTQREAGTN